MLLAGDIGGTKTDLAIFSVEGGPHAPLAQTQVHSADYPSLQALVTEFLKKVKMPVERACFDVAGPVIDGRVKITNLPWVMDEASLAKDLNLKSVHLMNDLEAVARAIPILRPSDVSTLKCRTTGPEGRHRCRRAGHWPGGIISYLGWIEVCCSRLRRRSLRFCPDG